MCDGGRDGGSEGGKERRRERERLGYKIYMCCAISTVMYASSRGIRKDNLTEGTLNMTYFKQTCICNN